MEKMAKARTPINSEKDLREHAISILRRVTEDERGGLLFLLNPVFALEEAGFDLNPEMRQHILRGLRYGAKTKAQIRALEESISQTTGHRLNVLSDAQVAHLLFEELKLNIPPKAETSQPAQEAATSRGVLHEREPHARDETSAGISGPETIQGVESKPSINLEILTSLRDQHPVVPHIIELRKLLRTGWRFVNRETYDKVKKGATVPLLRRVRFKRGKNFLQGCLEGGPTCR